MAGRARTMVVGLVCVAVLMAVCGTASAIIIYPNRASFDAAHPDAVLEDFEEANVADGTWGTMVNPLDSSTNNDIFSPGDIIDGLRLRGLRLRVGTGTAPDNMVVSSPGVANYVSHAISYDSVSTSKPEITIELLGGDVIAFAVDLTSNPSGNNLDVELFSGATSLGVSTVNNVQGSGTFFGALSDAGPITRVTVQSQGDWFGVDNIALADVIPEPATLSLLGLGALALLRRRKRA